MSSLPNSSFKNSAEPICPTATRYRPLGILRVLPLLLMLLILFTTACQPDRNSNSGGTDQDDRPPGLTLMTFRYLKQDADLIKAYEDRIGQRVRVIVRDAPQIIAEARTTGSLPADVVLLPSLEYATQLQQTGALQPFFVNSFTNGNVGEAFIDREGYFSGLTRWSMAAVYNPNAVTAEEAGSYQGILEAPLRGVKLGAAHPDSSGAASVVAGLNATLNETAAGYWAKGLVQKSTGGMQGNDYRVLDRMLAGELDMGLVSSGSLLRWFLNGDPQHYAAGDQWRIRLPKVQATGDNLWNMTCITMPAAAPNRRLASDFIDYLYEKPVQEALSSAYFEYPVQSFATPENYLYTIKDGIGRNPQSSVIEDNLPIAWELLGTSTQ